MTLPPVKKWSESGEKSAQIKHRLQAKTINMWLDCDVRDISRWSFFTGGSVIMD